MKEEYLPYFKRNLQVALPVMATQAGQVIVQLADNIMVGHLGAMELAGVSFANALIIIGMVTAMCFSQGILPLVGQCFGKGEKRSITVFFTNAGVLNLIMSGIVCIVMCIIGLFLNRMGQEEVVVGFAREYYFISILSLVPTIIFSSIRYFSEGLGNTRNAMWITISTNLLNIFLNWIMIFGHWGCPALGVPGAAYATLISRIIAAGAFIILLFTDKEYKPYMNALRGTLSRKVMKVLLKISIPISAQGLLEVCTFSLAAIMVGWIGAYHLAAHQIAQNLSSLTFMIAMGIGSAATIRVSHQYGEGNLIGVRMAGKAAIFMSAVFMGTFGLIFIILNKQIPLLYTSDQRVIDIAWKLIVVMSLYQVFDAIQMASINALKGLKDITVPLIISSCAYYLICLPIGYLMGFVFKWGAVGVWIGLLIGLAFNAVFFYIRFDRLSKRLIEK